MLKIYLPLLRAELGWVGFDKYKQFDDWKSILKKNIKIYLPLIIFFIKIYPPLRRAEIDL
jgi:hypothetical protein